VREHHERARVVGHRAGDVEYENEAAPALAPGSPCPLERLSARPEGAAERPAEVRRAAPRRRQAARPSKRHGERHASHQLCELGELLRRAAREALFAEKLDWAREPPTLLLDRALDADARTRATVRLRSRAEELPEHAVVDGDVAPACHEGDAAGPVEVVRREQRSGAAERRDATGPDGDALGAQRAAEDRQPPERVSHRRARAGRSLRGAGPRGSSPPSRASRGRRSRRPTARRRGTGRSPSRSPLRSPDA
jgi:hypothetical protein